MALDLHINQPLDRHRDAQVEGKREDNKAEAKRDEGTSAVRDASSRTRASANRVTLSRDRVSKILESLARLTQQAQGTQKTAESERMLRAQVDAVLKSLPLTQAPKPKEESKTPTKDSNNPAADLKKTETGMTAQAVTAKGEAEGGQAEGRFDQSRKLDLAKLLEGKDPKSGEESSINKLLARVEEKGRTPELSKALAKPSIPALVEELRGFPPAELATALAEAKELAEALQKAFPEQGNNKQQAEALAKARVQVEALVRALETVVSQPSKTPPTQLAQSQNGTAKGEESSKGEAAQILNYGDAPPSSEHAEKQATLVNLAAQFSAMQNTTPANPGMRQAASRAASFASKGNGEVTIGKLLSKKSEENGKSGEGGVKGQEGGDESSVLGRALALGFRRGTTLGSPA